jgi:hypothetical protein
VIRHRGDENGCSEVMKIGNAIRTTVVTAAFGSTTEYVYLVEYQ